MRQITLNGLFCLAVAYVLAHFAVLFFNHWYFAGHFWLKVGLLTPLIAAGYFFLVYTPWRTLWLALGWYWIAAHLFGMAAAGGAGLREMEFVAVLNYEAAVVWLPIGVIWAYVLWQAIQRQRAELRRSRISARQLGLRKRMRRMGRKRAEQNAGKDIAVVVIAAAVSLACLTGALSGAARAESDEPQRITSDRHEEFTNPALERPEWPAHLPTPMHERGNVRLDIAIDNRPGGEITVYEAMGGCAVGSTAGHVITPVTATNPRGFTGAGWAKPGTVCASAVNAIHVKTDHDYASGRSSIFSILPLEMAEVDPHNYQSYLSHETSLQTDIPAGTSIFGGWHAPLVGSEIWYLPADRSRPATITVLPNGEETWTFRASPGWVPEEGQLIYITWRPRNYDPEWIEFENGFGGLIWVKELGLEPYPIGQVLKPVAGSGRFLGTQYAEVGRIRAAHPGVICISTSPLGTIGGFQIIPRDHAMSPEMIYTRYKTQWMVVGPLWALDPSWEGLPPLFSDYLYPAFTPAMNDDGTVNEDVSGAEVFLNRFTVRARYSDADDPEHYQLLQEAPGLDNYALKRLTHVRIYFPRVNSH